MDFYNSNPNSTWNFHHSLNPDFPLSVVKINQKFSLFQMSTSIILKSSDTLLRSHKIRNSIYFQIANDQNNVQCFYLIQGQEEDGKVFDNLGDFGFYTGIIFSDNNYFKIQPVKQMFNYFLIPTSMSNEACHVYSPLSQKTQTSQSNSRELQTLQKKYTSLKKKFEELEKQNVSLKIEIEELEAKLPQVRKRKIKRRAESQLVKDFRCPFEKCLKEYASELALNLHMKMKHNAGTKKQRIQLVSNLIEASHKGEPQPQIYINLPPNYLEEFEKAIEAKNQKVYISEWEKFETGHLRGITVSAQNDS